MTEVKTDFDHEFVKINSVHSRETCMYNIGTPVSDAQDIYNKKLLHLE